MNNLIKTNENISTLAIAYYDEVEEVLKEIDSSLYFALSPLSLSYKRLYLIGDLLYQGNVTITATLPNQFQENYTIKLRLGEIYNNVDDFTNSTNTVTGNYKTVNFKYSNAVPLDVLIYSLNVTEEHTEILFKLESGETEFNCDNCTNMMTFNNAFLLTPMEYGNARYILNVNGVDYIGTDQSTTGTSIVNGISTVFSSNEILYNRISYYMSSGGDGENNGSSVSLQSTFPDECLTLSLKAEITYTYNNTVIETRNIFNSFKLCKGNAPV